MPFEQFGGFAGVHCWSGPAAAENLEANERET